MKKVFKITLLLLAMLVSVITVRHDVFAQNMSQQVLNVERRYNGQQGYGSSGIINCEEYLKDKYKANVSTIAAKKVDMINSTQKEFESMKGEGNCTLVAITRVIHYYATNGYIDITNKDVDRIYETVRQIAIDKYNYTGNGINMLDLKSLINDVLAQFGCKATVSLKPAIWSFNKHIKPEIDNGNPIILTNAEGFGYYRKHALVISGYKICNVEKNRLFGEKHKQYPMLEVYDGWTNSVRYIDYRKFKREMQNLTSIVTTISVKGGN